MDDTAQAQNDPQQVKKTDQAPQEPSASQSSVPSAPTKEAEPVVMAEASEVLTPSEKEPELSEEVKEAGVEAVSDHPKVTQEEASLGIKVVNEATPVATEPTGQVQLPMLKSQAQQAAKKSKVSDSIKWLAALIVRQYAKLGKV